jgi:hypothetical protein
VHEQQVWSRGGIAVEHINEIVRFSSNVFACPTDFHIDQMYPLAVIWFESNDISVLIYYSPWHLQSVNHATVNTHTL